MDTPTAKWWHAEDDRLVCDLCPRACRLNDNARGFCFVRQRQGDKMVLTTHGKSTGFTIDPIDKKPLNHFLPGTPILSFGTAGCNLGCKFCQNWSISKARSMERNLDHASAEEIVQHAKHLGCRSIAFTYNDPVIWAEFAIEVAEVARREGIHTVAVTAGYICPEPRAEFFSYMDAANIDLKSIDPQFYRSLTLSHQEPVLDTIRWLHEESTTWFELTNLIIPGENDSREQIDALCHWIMEHLGPHVPLHFSAFHPDYKLRDRPRTPIETLIRARTQAFEAGLRYAYIGNVLDTEHQSTYCPRCGTCVIERNHYEITGYRLQEGACAECGHQVPGYFEDTAGTWGRKRVPISIHANPETIVALPEHRSEQLTPGLQSVEREAIHAATAVNEVTAAARDSEGQEVGNEPSTQKNSDTVRTEFSEEEQSLILRYAHAVCAAVLTQRRVPMLLPPALAESPAFGAFVTLRRGSLLRACRGIWGDPSTNTVGAAITSAAVSTATSDPRFPSLIAQELALLTLEVSLMHSPQPINDAGAERAKHIELGVHGLVLTHPRGRSIFLPNVAAEQGWNISTYLERLAAKAGLALDAWSADEAQLMTFQTKHFVQPAAEQELEVHKLPEELLKQLLHAADSLATGRATKVQLPTYVTTTQPGITAIYLETPYGLSGIATAHNASLIDLLKRGVAALQSQASQRSQTIDAVVRCDVFSQPIPLLPGDYPNRHHTLTRSAVLAESGQRRTMIVPDRPRVPPDKVGAALSALDASHETWQQGSAALVALSARSFRDPSRAVNTRTIRQPAVAGSFYPASPEKIEEELDAIFSTVRHVREQPARAVMLPHAGWRYCSELIAQTLMHVEIPRSVIILAPKHTRPGERWSVDAHDAWQLPHCRIPVLTRLAHTLTSHIDALSSNKEAHMQEHSIEVLLPFLHRINPELQILPIVLGHSPFEELKQLAVPLARLLSAKEPPLIVVSTDMNHYGTEEKNRELDTLALDALETGDPRVLYGVCAQNKISMCGMIGAAAVLHALHLSGTPPDVRVIGYHTSARATGDTSRVVGYAGAVIR